MQPNSDPHPSPDAPASLAAEWLTRPAVAFSRRTASGLGVVLQQSVARDAPELAPLAPVPGELMLILAPAEGVGFDGQDAAERQAGGPREPWTMILLPADAGGRWATHARLGDAIHLRMPPAFFSRLAQGRPGDLGERILWTARSDIEALARLLHADLLSGSVTDLMLESYAALFVARLARTECQDAARKPSGKGGLAAWQVRRTTEHLRERIAHEVSLQELADLVHLSPFHFARAFRRSTGLPPRRYQLRLRVERAKALLRDAGLPIGEIAARVGYDAPQTLARLFRREVGMSPSAFRRRMEA